MDGWVEKDEAMWSGNDECLPPLTFTLPLPGCPFSLSILPSSPHTCEEQKSGTLQDTPRQSERRPRLVVVLYEPDDGDRFVYIYLYQLGPVIQYGTK